MNVLGQSFQKLEHYRQTHIETDGTERITNLLRCIPRDADLNKVILAREPNLL